MQDQYTDTATKLARESEVTAITIALYDDLGLLDSIRASNGMRLFKPGQAPKVREIYTARIARRGARHAP